MSADTPTPSETPKYDACTKKEQTWLEKYFAMGMNQTAASRSMGYKAPEQHGLRMSKNVGVKAAIQERLDGFGIEANEVLYRIDQRARATAEDFVTFEEEERATRIRVPIAEAIEQEQADLELARLQLDAIPEDEPKQRDRKSGDIATIERHIRELEVLQEFDPESTRMIDGPLELVTVGRLDLAKMREAGKMHLVKSVKEDKDGSVKVELHDAAHADDVLAKVLGLLGPKGTEDDPIYTEGRQTIVIAGQEVTF